MAAVLGTLAQLGVGSSSTVDQPLSFLSESLTQVAELVPTEGIVGSRSVPSERTREGLKRSGGTITLHPTALELTYLLPKILGAAASGTTFALAETLPSFYTSIDRVMKVFTYAGCAVNRATFRGSPGQPLELSLDLLAMTETVGNAGSFPAITIDVTTQPFMFHDLALTIASTTYQFFDFSLTVDNMLDAERFLNSQTRVSIPTNGRVVSVELNTPYGDSSALYGLSSAGQAVAATFTNGATSILFSMPAVQFTNTSPNVPGKGEIRLPLTGVARKSGSTKELTVTLDSTP